MYFREVPVVSPPIALPARRASSKSITEKQFNKAGKGGITFLDVLHVTADIIHDYYWQKEDAILHSQTELNDITGRAKWTSYDPFKPK
jgi:hypothetical protein